MSKIKPLCIQKRRAQIMKKSKLSVGLVTSFIGALALTSCGETPAVTTKEGTLVEIVDYNGNTLEIKTDDMYKEYSESSAGRKLYYDAVLEALIRYEYPKLNEAGLEAYSTLVERAKDAVESAKQTANDNKDSNGTTYEEEWEKILESHDCENEDDLKEYYLYTYEKEELSDWYAKSNIDTLKDEYIGLDNAWDPVAQSTDNVAALYPYHILHTLVTLSASQSDYVRGTITSDEAKTLWQTVRQLIDASYSFESIASSNLNGDTGSRSTFGDVGIMTTKTSFYNEFKLGIYAYDAILSGVNAEDAKTSAIYKAFGLDAAAEVTTETNSNGSSTSGGIVKEAVGDMIQEEMVARVTTPVSKTTAFTQIPTVPYEVFKRIGELAEETKINNIAPESGDVVLPRNILFNQFLNFHSPFVITDEDIKDNDNYDVDAVTTESHDFANGASTANPENTLRISNTNFVAMTINGVAKNVLCDKNGDVIIGVRSEAGIHFMLMRKSIFQNTNTAAGKATQSLQDYYTTDTDAALADADETYINMKKTDDQSYYKDRASNIKDAVKSADFDAAYDYRLYEYLVKGKNIEFTDDLVRQNIEEYIKLLRESKKASDSESINEAWQTYLLMLRYQNTVRNEFEGSLLPSTCAFKFSSANANEFKKGGRCYVEK